MKLPPPSQSYSQNSESLKNRLLEQADQQNRKLQVDVEIATGERLILSSPNGTRYKITVNDAGAISATSL